MRAERQSTPNDSYEARAIQVIVAVLTYKRPEPLRTCLSAIQNLEVPAGHTVSILVIDNDPDRSAIDAADSWRAISLRYPLHLVHEPRRGIPTARNRALDEALAVGADLLCFLDDDEYPDTTLASKGFT